MDRRSQESFNFVKHTSTIFIPDSFIKIGGINSVAGNICVGKHWKKHVIFAVSNSTVPFVERFRTSVINNTVVVV